MSEVEVVSEAGAPGREVEWTALSTPPMAVSPVGGRRLRVLHVAEAFGGGLLEVVRQLCDRGVEAGFDMAVAYGRRPETPDDVSSVLCDEVDTFDLGWERHDRSSNLNAAYELHRVVGAWKPDVVHLHSSFAGVIGAAVMRGRVPTVFTPHAFASAMASRPWHSRTAISLVERAVVRASTVVGAVSESEAAVARRLGARNVRVIPNGIPELDVDGLGMLPDVPACDPPRVVATGRLVGQRRPHACARILEACSDVADVRWVGGGDPAVPFADDALLTLHRAGVHVTGWMPRERALAEVAAADVYLHWTEWDGLPLSVLEAMAVDTIVVTSNPECNADLLAPEQVCENEWEAASLIRRVLADDALRERLLEGQRERRVRYSASRMVRQWSGLYEELALASAGARVPAPVPLPAG